MAKTRSQYLCQACGEIHSRWVGKCDSCNEWNTIVEDDSKQEDDQRFNKKIKKGRPIPLVMLSEELIEEESRIQTHISELDRVTGGGFVRGSVILVGGDPGIGKSTLLMQAAASLAYKKHNITYVSGEESIGQIRLRSQRLNTLNSSVQVGIETNVEDIIETLLTNEKPDLVIIDSIQTLWSQIAESSPGTVIQVRTSVQLIIQYAKTNNVSMVLVGHVTKEGQIAGPRVIEHMVDAVLYFEGGTRNAQYDYRILRSVKNRFGPTDEIGVFEMSDKGLQEVSDPSKMFLSNRDSTSPGAAVFAGIEGTRALLVEIQSLVVPTSLGMPRRTVVGWDSSRLAMILAVLEARCKIKFGNHDVHLNVAGGYRISEPAADLAVAAALISSIFCIPLPSSCIYFGEVSLSGDVRPVGHIQQRLKEAEKIGFLSGIFPEPSKGECKIGIIDSQHIINLSDLVQKINSLPKKED
ncbi:DNA repair protein RadA [Candidatus Liberibacter solanacearum]|uniref:DNA repair protein RadA n=1 Tax=Candidatus Liberibacter solanacearum TaxID=556287 RepID=A0A094ZZX4_9HYPH|nr:DNA repair protein RadA [Candidatus Liberibacter solanacearum]KGB27436.1 DNA repair protein RadA [Candidatus Liberibacter solanacearum]KJZ81153.1 DNA repair protein RadA [Candidatus Liberibacter solanacearum]KJZ82370.1 DNA repair protein RadA [Candidatus Liberibacter solanacearum]KQC49239.1 DNA repair protein RadA [Candidatus Liberibacter solanacearum]